MISYNTDSEALGLGWVNTQKANGGAWNASRAADEANHMEWFTASLVCHANTSRQQTTGH